MATSFAAAPQALGYLFQARVALSLLLGSTDEATVKVEGLDDLEIAGADGLKLAQLKHHIKSTAQLTDSSPDLWKSIRVWATHILGNSFSIGSTRLCLMTTAAAQPGSIAYMLGLENRDPARAEQKLNEIAESSTNNVLASSFAAFTSLSSAQRSALVQSIYVLTGQENIEAVRARIRRALRPSVRAQHVDGLCERVEGWWFDQVTQHLLRRAQIPVLSAFEVFEKVASFAEQFRDDNLPIDYEEEVPDGTFLKTAETKLFVRQLQALEVAPRTLTKAVLDYYRAFNQRLKWLEEGLVGADEVTRYERKLVDEWERYFDAISAETPVTNEELLAIGRKVLRWAELECDLRIRARVDADFVRRGSFHILANQEPLPAIYWHPTFLDTLKATMQKAAAA